MHSCGGGSRGTASARALVSEEDGITVGIDVVYTFDGLVLVH